MSGKRVATSTALQGDIVVNARAVALTSPYGTEVPNATCQISLDCSPEECGKNAIKFTTGAVEGPDPVWEEDAEFKLDFPEEPEEFVMKISIFEDQGSKGKITLGSCALALPIPKDVWRGKFARRLHTHESKSSHHDKGPPPGAVVLEVTFRPLNSLIKLRAAAKAPQRTRTRIGETDGFGAGTSHIDLENIGMNRSLDSNGVVESVPFSRPAQDRAGSKDLSKSVKFDEKKASPPASPRTGRRRGVEAAADIMSIPFDFDPPEDTDLIGTLKLCIASAWGLRNADVGSKSDPYVKVRVPTSQAKKEPFITQVIDDTLEPDWDEEREFFINWHEPGPLELKFEIWDRDNGLDDDLLGKCSIQMPTETAHIRYICAVEDPKASPKKQKQSKFAKGPKQMKPGFQFDVHFWHLGQDQEEDYDLEEKFADNVAARVDPERMARFDERIIGLQKRLPMLEKSLAKAQAERDEVLAEYEENKSVSQELEETLRYNEEIKQHLQDMLIRSEDIQELIEDYGIGDDTGARLIGIHPERPPLLEEVFTLREAAVWLVFERISEEPDHSLAHVSQLEALLQHARPSKPDSPMIAGAPTPATGALMLAKKEERKKRERRKPKIKDVLPLATKLNFNQVLDTCNAMQFSTAEWKRLLSYGEEEEDEGGWLI